MVLTAISALEFARGFPTETSPWCNPHELRNSGEPWGIFGSPIGGEFFWGIKCGEVMPKAVYEVCRLPIFFKNNGPIRISIKIPGSLCPCMCNHIFFKWIFRLVNILWGLHCACLYNVVAISALITGSNDVDWDTRPKHIISCTLVHGTNIPVPSMKCCQDMFTKGKQNDNFLTHHNHPKYCM